jgi:catechol-2,3-dioxygenase
MIQVRRLGHATFETPDVARQADYYAEVIGLQVRRDGNRAILSTGRGEERTSRCRSRPTSNWRTSARPCARME